tara:strand:+ start:1247 stop:4006 length:2760 start_codon:yes stop_codon:yes gene_type:complete
MAKTFVSPGVFTSEKDLTFVAQQVGVTTLGVVGETLKGPAFEPIFITNYNEYKAIFGGLDPKKDSNNKPRYEASYIAKHYLTESNQLFVTRILGLTGYDAGSSWLITASANYDPSTITTISSTVFTASYTGLTYDNFDNIDAEYVYSLGLFPSGPNATGVSCPNDTNTYPNGIIFDKTGSSFTGVSVTINTVNTTGSTIGVMTGTVVTYTADAYSQYENVVLAMLRSRADHVSDVLNFRINPTTGVALDNMTSALTNPLASFTLSATTSGLTSTTSYTVSLDDTSRDYITGVFGVECQDKSNGLFVEEIYPQMLEDMIANKYILGLNSTITQTNNFENYKQGFQTPETPWVVSELRGTEVQKLFKLISISDGTSANKEIKMSIANIKPGDKTFDVVVRDFYDTDSKPVILERFAKCDMDTSSTNYVGRRIGTADGEFVLRSKYIMAVLNEDASIDTYPAGFEGYLVRDYPGTVQAPYIDYKTTYLPTSERIKKVYLGISNVTGIDQNMFNWKGYTNSSSPTMWSATTKGFHMDSGATVAGNFEVGESEFRSDAGIEGTNYSSLFARKFTFVPYLGFDGWDCYRTSRTNTDRYKIGGAGYTAGLASGQFTSLTSTEGTSDYYAYLDGLDTFRNPESVNINVFTTPGIDYSDNLHLTNEAIDLIEEDRADSLYVLSSPEGVTYGNSTQLTSLGFSTSDVSTAVDMVDLLDIADIDSNYTCTYWPWLQEKDSENTVNVWLPPTLEVVRNIALTDNVAFPWFAVAGYSRGLTKAIKPRVKLTEDDRDTLYEGRINPIAYFADEGTIIWGNKNLQVKDSALDRINIRRLLLQARKLVSAVAVRLLFEQNDQIVRGQFLNLVNPILDNIRKERGLVDFRVVLSDDPEEIDRNEMRGKIFLKPIPTLEFIEVEFNVTSTGASFDNI